MAFDKAPVADVAAAEFIMAFDRSGANRFKDEDGRLHILKTNISKATVNGYRGSEIPNHEALGLEPDRVYQLLRDPEELAKAAATFNGLQLLSTHKAVNAENPEEHLVAGALGTEAEFNDPYLTNRMTIWRQEDIDDVESRDKCELSCAYYYEADMTPGAYKGQPYDGVMRNIRGNHTALVKAGRAGPDVLVADSAIPMENLSMAQRPLSARATFLKGVIAAYLKPKLIPGTTLALDAALGSVNSVNFKSEKAKAITAIIGMASGKLAKDATLEDMHDFVDRLDGETVEAQDWEDDDVEAMDAAEAEEENKARKEEREKAMKAEDRKAARDARKAARDAKRRGMDEDVEAMDESEAEEEKAARKKEAEDKMPMDARMKAAKDRRAARDAKRAKDGKRAKDTETEEERMERERKMRGEDKKAMDAAIAKAEAGVVARMTALAVAREDVRPLIGNTSMALDSASAVYKLALDHFKVEYGGDDLAAMQALVKQIPKPGAKLGQPPAMDAKLASNLENRFPMLSRIAS